MGSPMLWWLCSWKHDHRALGGGGKESQLDVIVAGRDKMNDEIDVERGEKGRERERAVPDDNKVTTKIFSHNRLQTDSEVETQHKTCFWGKGERACGEVVAHLREDFTFFFL